MKKIISLGKFPITCWLVSLGPIIILLSFIIKFSVNVPLWDEWALVDTFNQVYAGEITLKNLAAQHNEHRILFPRLIFILLAFPFKWNVIYEQYFSVFLTFIAWLAIAILALKQTNHRNKTGVYLANFLSSILLFSVVQSDSWLFGFQLIWLLINTCVAIAVFLFGASRMTILSFLMAALTCFIASFSAAHGLVAWIAILPCIVYSVRKLRPRIIITALWGVCFAVSAALYFIGYHKPPSHPNTLYFFEHPWIATRYFFTLLGGFSIRSLPGSTIAGLILFVIFCYYAFRFTSCYQRAKFAAPWLSIGLFPILFALIATIGRSGFGVEQAMTSRYTTNSVFLVVAIVQLFRLSLYSTARDRTNLGIWPQRAFQFFVFTIIGIVIVNSVQVVPEWQFWYKHKAHTKTCLELIHYMDESHFEDEPLNSCLRLVFPSTQLLQTWVASLEKMRFRDFPQDLVFVDQPSVKQGEIESPDPNVSSSLVPNEEGKVQISGWAKVPNDSNPVKLILLSANDRKQFFASAPISKDSPNLDDETSDTNGSNYREKRWSADIVIESLPPDVVKIGAWMYNPAEKQFVRLSGDLVVIAVEGS